MHSNTRSAAVSRPLFRITFIALALMVFGIFATNTSAQMQNTTTMFSLNSLRLPVPSMANFAHPVARLIGTSEHVDQPRPFRQRIVLLASNRTVSPVAPVALNANIAPAPMGDVSATPQEMRALQLINKERQAKGLNPLSWDPLLSRCAHNYSTSMATLDFFNHVSPDGKTASDRMKALGLHGWRALGENIAYNQGYDDPVAFAVERWMASPMHRENLLNPMWSTTAVGIATAADGRIFFTELFLAR